MEFVKIILENYRCFVEETVEFEEGVTVLTGRNGAGKSTILESCYFALYGYSALQQDGNVLGDVIREGEDTTVVELIFLHNSGRYRISREIRQRSGTTTQAVCELEKPSETITGVNAVDEEIRELIRMDASAFLNCSYVRQGEIEKLIKSDDSERRKLIDRLLQLGKIEVYENRIDDVRVGTERVIGNKETMLEDRKDTIADIEDQDLRSQLEAVNNRIADLDQELEDAQEEKGQIGDEINEIDEEVEEAEQLQEGLEELERDLEEVTDDLEDFYEERSDLSKKSDNLEEELEQLQSSLDEFREDEGDGFDVPQQINQDALDTLNEHREEIADQLTTLQNEVTKKQTTLENKKDEIKRVKEAISEEEDVVTETEDKISIKKETIREDLQPELDNLQDEKEEITTKIDQIKAEFEGRDVGPNEIEGMIAELQSQRDELISDRADLEAEVETIENKIEEAKELKSQGKCPKCGQDTEESPEVLQIKDLNEQVKTHKSRLTEVEEDITAVGEQIEQYKQLKDEANRLKELAQRKRQKSEIIDKQKRAVGDANKEIQELQSQIEEVQANIDELEDQKTTLAEEIESLESDVGEKEETIENITQRKTRIGKALELASDIHDCKNQLAQLEDQITRTADLIQAKEETEKQAREEYEELKDSFSDIDISELTDKRQQLENDLNQLNNEIDSLKETIVTQQQRKGKIKEQLKQLEGLYDEVKELQTKLEDLGRVKQDIEKVTEMYTSVRSELRTQNIAHLERLLNEVFSTVYQNDAYDRIEVDEDYHATIIDNAGESMDPKKLSRGESTLLNLSLRCAIYQLLVEGISDVTPMPPLILDEPTVHLDEGHVGQISALVERMRTIGVEQVIVVSHTDEVIDSASQTVSVIQEPATNSSKANVKRQKII